MRIEWRARLHAPSILPPSTIRCSYGTAHLYPGGCACVYCVFCAALAWGASAGAKSSAHPLLAGSWGTTVPWGVDWIVNHTKRWHAAGKPIVLEGACARASVSRAHPPAAASTSPPTVRPQSSACLRRQARTHPTSCGLTRRSRRARTATRSGPSWGWSALAVRGSQPTRWCVHDVCSRSSQPPSPQRYSRLPCSRAHRASFAAQATAILLCPLGRTRIRAACFMRMRRRWPPRSAPGGCTHDN